MGKKDEDVEYVEGCPGWMLTMGDCMSLLVTFFVLLMSFSTRDNDKLMDALFGIRGALSIMEASVKSNRVASQKEDENAAEGDIKGGGKRDFAVKEDELAVVNLRSLKVANKYNEFRERLLELGFANIIQTDQLEQGISADIGFHRLFLPNTDRLMPRSYQMLVPFANLANSVGNELRVTACFPLNMDDGIAYHVKWRLARQRALKIGEVLNKRYNISKVRMSYGNRVIPDGKPGYIQLLLVEKLGTSKVSIEKLMNMEQGI